DPKPVERTNMHALCQPPRATSARLAHRAEFARWPPPTPATTVASQNDAARIPETACITSPGKRFIRCAMLSRAQGTLRLKSQGQADPETRSGANLVDEFGAAAVSLGNVANQGESQAVTGNASPQSAFATK